MKAYHGNPELKEIFMARVKAHRAADELIQGATEGRRPDGTFSGCAVVCTMEAYEHKAYETEIGVPMALARIEDGIFEELPATNAMAWPEEFLEAIPVGADLACVADRFLHWLLVDPTDGVIRHAKTDRAKKAIRDVADLYAKKIAGEKASKDQWRAAAAAAATAATAAYAAYAAYDAAYAFYAAADVADVAYADVAYTAAYAAAAAAYAFYAAADVAADDVAYAAYKIAKEKARIRQAEKLIELMREAPVCV